jgi:hypothetical protein
MTTQVGPRGALTPKGPRPGDAVIVVVNAIFLVVMLVVAISVGFFGDD